MILRLCTFEETYLSIYCFIFNIYSRSPIYKTQIKLSFLSFHKVFKFNFEDTLKSTSTIFSRVKLIKVIIFFFISQLHLKFTVNDVSRTLQFKSNRYRADALCPWIEVFSFQNFNFQPAFGSRTATGGGGFNSTNNSTINSTMVSRLWEKDTSLFLKSFSISRHGRGV